MEELNIYYWSHGPHYQFRDSLVFITWRLAGTLPSHILKLFQQLRKADNDQDKAHDIELMRSQNARLFKLYQDYDLELAKWENPGFSLNDEAIAKLIAGAFQYYAGRKYELHAYCVMRNHVHLLIRALPDVKGECYLISDIVRSLKSYTAHETNRILHRTGQFWDDFHFDRIIRDERDYANVVNYILMNPVAAGLVDKPEKWRDSYSNLSRDLG